MVYFKGYSMNQLQKYPLIFPIGKTDLAMHRIDKEKSKYLRYYYYCWYE